MRGECVAKGEASKKAGEGIDNEDLEDVFHNCTRSLKVTQLRESIKDRKMGGEGLAKSTTAPG